MRPKYNQKVRVPVPGKRSQCNRREQVWMNVDMAITMGRKGDAPASVQKNRAGKPRSRDRTQFEFKAINCNNVLQMQRMDESSGAQ